MNESFEAAIKRLQSLAGHSTEQLETLRRSILAMAEHENSERDTHFANAAKLLWERLTSADTGNFADSIDVADASPYERLIAQFAYDLVYHALLCHGINQQYWPGGPLYGLLAEKQGTLYKQEITAATNEIPDLDAWPRVPRTSPQTDTPS